jgi:hypothetical protein
MQGNRFCVSVHLHGTLAANAQGYFQLPCAATLQEVSAAATNNSDATLQLGTSADLDGIMTAAAIGDSGTPVLFDTDNFNGALADAVNPLHLADNTIVYWLLDFDGSSGTAGQNVSLVFTFLEG